jgi:hypothetical protein
MKNGGSCRILWLYVTKKTCNKLQASETKFLWAVKGCKYADQIRNEYYRFSPAIKTIKGHKNNG